MKHYKYTIYILMIILMIGSTLAFECDADLNVTPCNVTSDLTLNNGVYVVGGDMFVGSDVVFDCADSTLVNASIFIVGGTNNVTVKNCQLENNLGWGDIIVGNNEYIGDISDISIYNNTLIYSGTNSWLGITIFGVTGSIVDNIEVVDNNISGGFQTTGLQVLGTSNVLLKNNVVNNPTGQYVMHVDSGNYFGYLYDAPINLTIDNNYFKTTSVAMTGVNAGLNVIFKNNYVERTTIGNIGWISNGINEEVYDNEFVGSGVFGDDVGESSEFWFNTINLKIYNNTFTGLALNTQQPNISICENGDGNNYVDSRLCVACGGEVDSFTFDNACSYDIPKGLHTYTWMPNKKIDLGGASFNLAEEISIRSNNITIDGNGATINGSGSGNIITVISNNIIIKNIDLTNANYGIIANNVDGLIVNNTNFYGMNNFGIQSEGMSNAIIENIYTTDSPIYELNTYGASDNLVLRNIFGNYTEHTHWTIIFTLWDYGLENLTIENVNLIYTDRGLTLDDNPLYNYPDGYPTAQIFTNVLIEDYYVESNPAPEYRNEAGNARGLQLSGIKNGYLNNVELQDVGGTLGASYVDLYVNNLTVDCKDYETAYYANTTIGSVYCAFWIRGDTTINNSNITRVFWDGLDKANGLFTRALGYDKNYTVAGITQRNNIIVENTIFDFDRISIEDHRDDIADYTVELRNNIYVNTPVLLSNSLDWIKENTFVGVIPSMDFLLTPNGLSSGDTGWDKTSTLPNSELPFSSFTIEEFTNPVTINGQSNTVINGDINIEDSELTLNGNGATINGVGSLISLTADNSIIRNLYLNGTSQISDDGIATFGFNGLLVENVDFQNVEFGIIRRGGVSDNLIIRNNTFESSITNAGVRINNFVAEGGDNLLIEDNIFYEDLFLRLAVGYTFDNATIRNNYFELIDQVDGNQKVEMSQLNNSYVYNNEINMGQLWIGDNTNTIVENIYIHDWDSPVSYRSPLQILGCENVVFDNITITNSEGASQVNYAVVQFSYGYRNGGSNITIRNSNWESSGNGQSIFWNYYGGYLDNVLFENNDINLSTTINSGNDNIQFIGNTLRQSITDNAAGTKWCDYNSFTGNTISSYSGVNFNGCAITSNYFNGDDTTDFNSVSDWSNVSIILDRVGYGKINFGYMNLSEKTNALNNIVEIKDREIIVNDSDNDYNKSGTLYFYGMPTDSNASDYRFLVDGELAVQGIDWIFSWKPDDDTLAVNTTHLSTWTIDEEVPRMSSVNLLPLIASVQNQLVGSCIAIDNDGGYLDYYYLWKKNGITIAGGGPTNLLENTEFSNTLGSTLNVGDNWTFYCYAEDELEQETGWIASNIVQILVNQLPIVQTYLLGSVAGNPIYDLGENMNAYCNVNDTNGDAVTVDWRIYRDTILVYYGEDVSVTLGVPKLVKVVNTTDLLFGQTWSISCKANDGYNETDYTNSTPVTIAKDARAPVYSYVRLFPEIVFNYSELSGHARASDINDGEILNYSFSLYVNDILVESKSNSNEENIAISVIFDYDTLVENDTIKVGVVISDTEYILSQHNSSEKIVRLTNDAPTMVSNRMSPNTFVGEDDNIAGYCLANDIENDRLRYNYIWYVNGNNVKSGTYSGTYPYLISGVEYLVNTLSYTYIFEEDIVIFSCQASDSVNISDYLNTSELYIYGENNYAPAMEDLNIVPSGSWPTTQTFNITAQADDRDGNDVRFEWRLVKNGLYQTLQTSSYTGDGVPLLIGTIDSSTTLAGDAYYVRARAYDGQQYSNWMSSNAISITNTAPIMENTSIITSPYENTTLQVLCSASDIDDQEVTFEYGWYLDGTLTNWTQDTLPFGETTAGQEWILSCRANDGYVYSDWLNSTPVIMIDTSTLPVMVLTTLEGGLNQLTGTCMVTDAEGDRINYTYQLYKNGILVNTTYENSVKQGLPQTQIFYETTEAGSQWKFGCRGIDIDGSTGFFNSSTVTIPSITFSYNIPLTTATKITVDWATNADTVRVYKNGVQVANTVLTRYIFEDLIPNTQYEIKLQPVKNSVSGFEYIFNVITIDSDNNAPTVSEVLLQPATIYTNTVITGSCRGTDIESQSILYKYYWYVNNVLVSNGITSLTNRDVTKTFSGLTTANYQHNDTIKVGCVAYDGLANSIQVNSSEIIVSNSEPILSEVFISFNSTEFVCNYEYYDVDDNNETTASFDWTKNNVSLGINSSTISTEGYIVNDELICTVITGDEFYSVQLDSNVFTVGDFELPVVLIQIVPSTVYTDTSYLIEAICSDNIGIALGYPKIRYITPNYLEEEYPLYYDGEDVYSKYHTFGIVGTYTGFEIECKDRNGNSITEELGGDIVALTRVTEVNIGGGETISIIDDDIERFRLRPTSQKVNIVSGDTKIVEFEIINIYTSDISVTMGILLDETNPETYQWMSFEGGLKAITFDIEKIGGLSTNNKFIRYYITVPDDVAIGKYNGLIEVNSGEQTKDYNVEITIVEGQFTPLLSFLNFELFEIPFTSEPITGAVIGVDKITEQGRPFTVWMLISILSIIGLGIYGANVLRKK